VPIDTQEDTRFRPSQSIQQFRLVSLSRTSKNIQKRLAGDDRDLQTRLDGEGPLLFHARYRLIRYHRRGYAGSTKHEPGASFSIGRQAADALAVLRHLGIERAHIVGHSYGGVIALKLAPDAPQVVHSLTLLEPAIMRDVPGGEVFGKQTMEPALARYRTGDHAGALDAFMRDVVR
jgi:pimeloyl-ACP methyl ester carboxylesterase